MQVSPHRQELYQALSAQIPGIALALNGRPEMGQPSVYAKVCSVWQNLNPLPREDKAARTFRLDFLVEPRARLCWASDGEVGSLALLADDKDVDDDEDTWSGCYPVDEADKTMIDDLCDMKLYPLLDVGAAAVDLAMGPGRILLTYLAVAHYTRVTVDEAAAHVLARNIVRSPPTHQLIWDMYMDVVNLQGRRAIEAFELSHRIPRTDYPDFLRLPPPRLTNMRTSSDPRLVDSE